MKIGKLFLLAVAAFCALPASGAPVEADARTIIDFNPQWKFFAGDVPHGEEASLNDGTWTAIAVPHDWSIAGPVDAKNTSGQGGGFFPTGVAWYRRSFSLPKTAANRRTYIAFDGVMANSDVWINGFHLGHRPNGFVSFYYDLTGHVQFGPGSHNVLAVRCDTARQPASRWYEGGGIYRPVRLVELNSVHLEPWSTVVTTPAISADKATVAARSTVINDSNTPRQVVLKIVLTAPDGRLAGTMVTPPQTVAPGTQAHFSGEIAVAQPQIWDITHPSLYRAHVSVNNASMGKGALSSGVAYDDERINFGIRSFHFDPETGFWLNGRNFKLKGAALHADGGAMGIAVPLSIWESRLTELRALGVNAIRTAHNPPSPDFLDLCDRMGFLVMDELFDCWTVAKPDLAGNSLADYHLYFNDWSKIDVADTVCRDRNHPSIILYSAGNEIHDTPQQEKAKKILSGLVEVFHANDPSRPVTQALFRPNQSHDYEDGLADLLDVVGQNYRETEILAAHDQKPSRKIIGTENRHDRATWVALRDHAPYAGQFLWTGVDYLGESRRWPVICSGAGLLDRTAAPRPLAFERQSWWTDAPMVGIARRTGRENSNSDNAVANNAADRRPQTSFSDWTPTNTQPHAENVEVYSNCKDVELFLNGKSLGAKTINADASPRTWEVSFAPGVLKAVARNNGKIVATDELRTAGRPAKIVLSTEPGKLSPGWDNVAFVRAKIVDANGITVPHADDLISFQISGPGIIAAVDNANNSSHEPFQTTERRAYQGRCVAFVKASGLPGKIILTAAAPGLTAGSIIIEATKPLPTK